MFAAVATMINIANQVDTDFDMAIAMPATQQPFSVGSIHLTGDDTGI
jgi:hypothetical protein